MQKSRFSGLGSFSGDSDPLYEADEDAISGMSKLLVYHKELSSALSQELAALKAEYTDVVDRQAEIEKTIITLTQERDAEIDQSKQMAYYLSQLRSQLSDKTSSLLEERSNYSARIKDIEYQRDNVVKDKDAAISDLENRTLKMSEDLHAQNKEYSHLEACLQEVKAQLSEKINELADLKDENLDFRRSILVREDEISQESERFTHQLKALQEELEYYFLLSARQAELLRSGQVLQERVIRVLSSLL